MAASRVSALPGGARGPAELQHGFRALPGLVADGRDMGTVVFPDATSRSSSPRAPRRAPNGGYKQLISKGFRLISTVFAPISEARDARDMNRSARP